MARKPPATDILEVDLCDHYFDVQGYRCQAYWTHEVVLDHDVHVTASKGGKAMWGTYGAGTWRFCNMHHRIFQRDRDPE